MVWDSPPVERETLVVVEFADTVAEDEGERLLLKAS